MQQYAMELPQPVPMRWPDRQQSLSPPPPPPTPLSPVLGLQRQHGVVPSDSELFDDEIDPSDSVSVASSRTSRSSHAPSRVLRNEFRFHADQVALTYSCPIDMDDVPIPSKEALIEELRRMFPVDISGYVCSVEKHQNGKRHFHVYLKFGRRMDRAGARLFDCFGVHPNIKVANRQWITYVVKHGDFIYEGVILPEDKSAATKARREAYTVAMKLAFDGNVPAAMSHLRTHQPERYVLQSDRIGACMQSEYLRGRAERTPLRVYDSGWSEEALAVRAFESLPGEDWIRVPILYGPSGIGKTELAKMLLRRAGHERVLVVSNIEDLHRLHEFTAFIIDECCFNADDRPGGAWARELQIGLVDVGCDRSFPARYRNVFVPAGIPRVITCNVLLRALNVADAAINRRVSIFEFRDPLFVR